MKLIVIMATAVAALALISIPFASGGTEHAQRAPRACTQAIDQARTVAGLAGQGFSIAGDMIKLVSTAFSAGLKKNVAAANAVVAKMKASTAKLNRLLPSVTAAAGKFNVYAAGCS